MSDGSLEAPVLDVTDTCFVPEPPSRFEVGVIAFIVSVVVSAVMVGASVTGLVLAVWSAS